MKNIILRGKHPSFQWTIRINGSQVMLNVTRLEDWIRFSRVRMVGKWAFVWSPHKGGPAIIRSPDFIIGLSIGTGDTLWHMNTEREAREVHAAMLTFAKGLPRTKRGRRIWIGLSKLAK